MTRKLHQPGPQTKIFLVIKAKKTLTPEFIKQQIGRAFRDSQCVNDRRSTTGANAGNQIENINSPCQDGNFA
ncbi:Uncharacterised protein [Shigella sonnei]|nr:Uncharacterised protein [Shigella sonnei]CSG41773.1 Uncharacterised protein [Shigella sonnei]